MMLVLDYPRSRLQGVAGNILAESLSPTVVKVMLANLARRGDRGAVEGLRDVATLRNLFSAQGLLALFDAPWALIYFAVIWLAHPVLGMAAAAASLLMLGLAVLNDRITRRDIEALQQEAGKASRYLESSMQNLRCVHGVLPFAAGLPAERLLSLPAGRGAQRLPSWPALGFGACVRQLAN